MNDARKQRYHQHMKWRSGGGYRPGYSEQHSPMYAKGVSDAEVDNALVANGKPPIGPQPPNPAYPVMYLRGYEDTFGTEDGAA